MALQPWLDNGSRMSREVHVRFCESLGVRFPRATHPYVRITGGFVYLTAIMDWHSRYVLSWEISTSMDTRFCIMALERALAKATPEIFNSDQGSQFTSTEFAGRLTKAGVMISRDGRGRVFDNIFVERLWRSVKYEEVYLKAYESVKQAKESLGSYFRFYNTERLHEALGYRTPLEVYLGKERLTTRHQALYLHLNQPPLLS